MAVYFVGSKSPTAHRFQYGLVRYRVSSEYFDPDDLAVLIDTDFSSDNAVQLSTIQHA
ncbi:MAG: hypothetical protein P4L95_17540 [Rouxiella aceris]|nr:hypothetical protein [Rouxiella aceris]MDR3433679.1 hypothetical protein [Rouxiella aceris]